MKQKISKPLKHLLILITIWAALFSCSNSTDNSTRRIISLSPSHTEILYALGLENDIVGWTMYCNYPPEIEEVPGWLRYDKYSFKSNEDELTKKVAVVSNFIYVNMELIDSLKPTLILSIHEMQREIAEDLKTKGYNVLHFEPVTLEEVFAMMEEIGAACGKAHLANELTAGYREEIENIKMITQDLPEVSVYFEIAHEGPYALGSGSPMDQIIDCAGGRNIFGDIPGESFKADLKEIVKRDPDVILTPLWPYAGREEVTTIREIVTRKGFENIKAVKNSRIYHYDSSLFKRPGPRQATAVRKLAYLLHPYYFKNPENSVEPWELGKIDETYPPPKPLK